jgi:hypothetical protein
MRLCITTRGGVGDEALTAGGRIAMPARTGGNNSVTDNTVQPLPQADRITVALIPQSTADLQALQERTSLSKTDLVNRAITLYEFIDAQLREGHDLIVRNKETGETQLVRFL